MSCLTVNVNEDCLENISTFSLFYEHGFGNCSTLLEFNTTTVRLTSHLTCLPVDRNSVEDICYRVTLTYQGTPIATKTNIDASPCLITDLDLFLGDGVSYTLDSSVNNGTVVHLTKASLSCNSSAVVVLEEKTVGAARTRCINGHWNSFFMRSCKCESLLVHVQLWQFTCTRYIHCVIRLKTCVVTYDSLFFHTCIKLDVFVYFSIINSYFWADCGDNRRGSHCYRDHPCNSYLLHLQKRYGIHFKFNC